MVLHLYVRCSCGLTEFFRLSIAHIQEDPEDEWLQDQPATHTKKNK
jgi:hypothetical protein